MYTQVSDSGPQGPLVLNKNAKMALNRSPEFKSVIVQILCVVENHFELAWALTNIISGTICHT